MRSWREALAGRVAAGSEDTELGGLMEPEVGHGETEGRRGCGWRNKELPEPALL